MRCFHLLLTVLCCMALTGCFGGSAELEQTASQSSTAAVAAIDVAGLTDTTFVEHAADLMNSGAYEAVITLAQAYREQVPAEHPSATLTLIIEADALRMNGEAEQGWEVFQLASPDYYPAPWTRTGMDILYDLGRRDEAYDFCAENLGRIPQYRLQQGVRQMCIRRSMQP